MFTLLLSVSNSFCEMDEFGQALWYICGSIKQE